TAAILNTRFHLQFPITVLAAIVVTLAMSLLLSIPSLRVKGTYLVLMTIGFGEVVRLLLQNWRSLTGGPNGIVGISSPNFYLFKLTNAYQYYYLVLFFIVILQLYLRTLMKSRVGRCLLAIRDDDRAAEMVGIDIAQYKIKAFGISAIYCAIAGTLYAHTIQFVDPNSFRADESQLILCCVIIGGIGTFAGPIVGAILLQTIPELFRGLESWRLVLYGVILMITIIFFPGGIAKYAGLAIEKVKGLLGFGGKETGPGAKTPEGGGS
ncbi:MAG: branched-chain amino acid ABC transporter permease, partial [Lachnospiraceae bacterium]|nr:branched-chain amino acid ABC transporter permease [Lachnospiraceae bacterium]